MSAANGSAQTVNGMNLAAGHDVAAASGKKEPADYGVRAQPESMNEGELKLALKPPAKPGTIPTSTPQRDKQYLLDKAVARTDAGKSLFSNSQRYVQIRPAAAPAGSAASVTRSVPGAAPVLASFQVEQSGGQIRVVDEDGSVYSGYLQLTNAPSAAPPAADQSLAPATANADQKTPPPAEQNYYFIVSGTNRSLNQAVLFTGNVVATADEALLRQQSNVAANVRGQLQKLPVNQLQLPLLNSRVTGTAWIENRKQIEINAAPAAP